jgi:hypothetical protein
MPSRPVTEHPTPLSTVLLLPSRHTAVVDGAGLDNNSFPLKVNTRTPVTHTIITALLLHPKVTIKTTPPLTLQAALHLSIPLDPIGAPTVGGPVGFEAIPLDPAGEATGATSKIRNGTAISQGVNRGRGRNQIYPKTTAVTPLLAGTPMPPTTVMMFT